MEGDIRTYPDKGTSQGGVISPILSNIFLHYVLDEWFVNAVLPRMQGRGFIIRFADDFFIIGCEKEADAHRVMQVLPKKISIFNLSLYPKKTVLIPFTKLPATVRKDKVNGKFDFLGFTFFWARSLKGYWVIKKKTAEKRARRFMKMIWQWCKKSRHEPINDQYAALCSKLRGFYQYYGVRSNYKILETIYEHAEGTWRIWLGRRSHRGTVWFNKLRTSFRYQNQGLCTIYNI